VNISFWSFISSLYNVYVKAQAIEEKKVEVDSVLVENLSFYGKAYCQCKGQANTHKASKKFTIQSQPTSDLSQV
jgi:hypothetical protein